MAAEVPNWHRLVAPDSAVDRAGETAAKEAEPLLGLCDRLLASGDIGVRACSSHLFLTVSR
jgi:hypothetical protein